MKAQDHPSYHDAIGYAVSKAQKLREGMASVYWDGEKLFVREYGEHLRPPDTALVCVVSSKGASVRIRFPRESVDMMGRPRPNLPQAHRVIT